MAISKLKKAAKGKFSVPLPRNKFSPIQYDAVSFERNKSLRRLDQRDLYLQQHYANVLSNSDVILFYHGSQLDPQQQQKYRTLCKAKQIRLEFLNRRVMSGVILTYPKYQNLLPLLSDFTFALYPYQGQDDVDSSPPPQTGLQQMLQPVDPVQFVRDSRQIISAKHVLLGGAVENVLFGKQELEQFAKMKTRKELNGELLGLLQSPASNITSVLGHSASQMVRLLQLRTDSNNKPSDQDVSAQ
ncbi:hypothetical protein MP228_001291 [Amoeboaphelidium protococcarum]|nr:hypothetical protein MP228_001291 [Amoeboaphelidium protococcarum]